ncbi:Short chain dehydrogenase andI [Sparassis crispa]|uniref:Short chain dehydrogenase andI n=1 Tax=Sparassis crispa TaxID=139825 RepID=A0A401GS78_9APHY|nr:Short chain dehydrogenase andI [Sparassis crispa]GBE85091.1 Short chain dehydrogenase andI [Sparassis crispa]
MALRTNDSSRRPSPLRPGSSFAFETPMDPTLGKDVHPVFHEGRVAVITGAASGIGRAAALEFAKTGLKIAVADVNEKQLREIGAEVAKVVGEANVLVVPTDVSKLDQVVRLRDRVYEAWGEVGVLMNNAGIGPTGTSWEGLDSWHKLFEVNVFGILNVQQTFVPSMLHQENPAVIINTGSKQGITNPPGNAAYNASKAAVKSLTEGLAHELRNVPSANLTAHLFVPGWTWTGMTGDNGEKEKPAGAWTAQETVLYMLDHVRQGKFYIVCPDNETRREVDQLRIMWAAGDVAEGRPALSRWHRDYKALFEEYIKDGLAQLD